MSVKLDLTLDEIKQIMYVCEESVQKFRVFWDVAPCSHVEVDRRFRGAYCLHHRPDDHPEDSINFVLAAVRT
jgi:hypothetical protein